MVIILNQIFIMVIFNIILTEYNVQLEAGNKCVNTELYLFCEIQESLSKSIAGVNTQLGNLTEG